MIDQNLTIGDLIEVPEVQTVIRLEQARTEPDAIAGSFVFTREVAVHFTVITESILKKKGQGYFLKGDFGSGKSHFLACLYTALDPDKKMTVLSAAHGGIKRIAESGIRLLPVDVSLILYRAQTSLEQIIIQAIEKALLEKKAGIQLSPLSRFLEWFRQLISDNNYADDFIADNNLAGQDIGTWIENHQKEAYRAAALFIGKKGIVSPEFIIEDRHELFTQAFDAVKSAGFDGVMLFIDELSEFFRSKPSPQSLNEDARTLQYLGELCQNHPLWIVAAVQESIEKTGDISQATFRKIKDRFPVTLNLSVLHIQSLISERLVKHKSGTEQTLYAIYEEFKKQFTTFSLAFNEFKSIYPVHPRTISMLDGLSDLFSIHRGIVDFVHAQIAGDPARNISGILSRPAMELLAPDSIFDHFENRIGEFSGFHVYPRHILPHLKEIIGTAIEDEKDRELALRLVKILILYKIHPANEEPTVRQLAEIAGRTLFLEDPDMNVRFIAEGILDPVADASRFLVKNRAPGSDPLETVYAIVSEESPGKQLKQRIEAKEKELSDDDSRLLMLPLSEIEESLLWPGAALLERGMARKIEWLQSQRSVFLRFLFEVNRKVLDEFYHDFIESKSDFGLIITPSEKHAELESTAFWHFPYHKTDKKLFMEYAATRLVCENLEPSRAADAPIVTEAREKQTRLQPLIHKLILDLVYSGRFGGSVIKTSPVIAQVRRFDRIIDSAGEELLSRCYPEFRKIAPHRVPPSSRYYQRLLDEFVIPGSIHIRDARTSGLADAVEGLAAPLGLVEAKTGTYLFSPSISESPLLNYFFSLLRASSRIPLEKVRTAMGKSEYGLPGTMFDFLVAALACSGLISLLKNGRTMPVSAISLNTIDKADEIAPGELIGKSDRETLMSECGFLFPQQQDMVSNGTLWESFGLSAQREVWKSVIKFKESAQGLSESFREAEARFTGYAAFSGFDLKRIRKISESLSLVADEIKISYAAKEGLERFLSAFRGSGLTADDIQFLKKFSRFVKTQADRFIFIHHYINHPETGKAAEMDIESRKLRNIVIELYRKPEIFIVEDDAKHLGVMFEQFRRQYAAFYTRHHEEYYKLFEHKPLSKYATRALNTITGLSKIVNLDRPEGLSTLLEKFSGKSGKECRRRSSEELQSSPACSCGYHLGDTAPPRIDEPEDAIEQILGSYIGILSDPVLHESLTAWSYAIREKDKPMADQLAAFCRALNEKKMTPASLLDFLGEEMIEQIGSALKGKLIIESRDLAQLFSRLKDRRLTASDAEAIFRTWLKPGDERTLFSFESDTALLVSDSAGSSSIVLPGWWPLLHRNIFQPESFRTLAGFRGEDVEHQLERYYPAVGLKKVFEELSTEKLIRFAMQELFHFQAVMAAWQIVCSRILHGEKWPDSTPVKSDFSGRIKAAEIENSFFIPYNISVQKKMPFPDQLMLRLSLDELASHVHAADELVREVFTVLEKWETVCIEWMETLEPVNPVDVSDNPVVVIFDGVSPDVWLHATGINEFFSEANVHSWHKLVSKALTVDAISTLFGFGKDAGGFPSDPSEEFQKRDIAYYSLKGNEEHPVQDHILPLPQKALVVRLSIVDKTGHAGRKSLVETAESLKVIFDNSIPALQDICRNEKRRLIITVDHGFTLRKSGLSHGQGGVFERIIPYAEWKF